MKDSGLYCDLGDKEEIQYEKIYEKNQQHGLNRCTKLYYMANVFLSITKASNKMDFHVYRVTFFCTFCFTVFFFFLLSK